ncbi:hypothetical protein IKG49_02935 [Candidatus Saccharibacteria bacterium]|nr:hypothetical protein [Candidatus Saccharibacteria bacterium]
MNTNKLNLIPLSLASITILAGTILASTYVSADDNSTVDQISITVPMSCTMSGTGQDSHNANINNGTYTPNIGTTTMHVFCNDNEGFAIYAAGYTGDEIGGENSNKLVGTSASGNAAIESGLATSAGNPDVSNWAMKLTMTQDSGDTTTDNAFTIDSAPNVALPSQAESGATQAPFSNYHVVPNEYVKVAHKNSGTDMTETTGGVKLTTTYAAYISKTQPADTYSGQVIYTLVHPSSHLAPGALTPPISCTTPVPGLKYMQDLTSSNKATILSNMTEDSQYYLADKRDDKTYCVAKLKDGNLWMTQNLDHDIKTDGSVTYNNTTTDLGWNGTSYSTASWTPASATKATSDTAWTTNGGGYYMVSESYDPGELYWNGAAGSYSSESDCATAGGIWNSTNNRCNQISSTGDSHYHLGNYYNWTAAVAMNDSHSYTANNQDANQSICPAGWTLPKSGNNTSNGSFRYLFEQYGWDSGSQMIENPNIWNTAIKLPLSGSWYGSLSGVGNNGNFWSSVVRSSELPSASTAQLYYYNSVNLGGSTRDRGNPVRCVAR